MAESGKRAREVWRFAANGLDIDAQGAPATLDGVDECLRRLGMGPDIDLDPFESAQNPKPLGLRSVFFRDAHVCFLVGWLRKQGFSGRVNLAREIWALTKKRAPAPWWWEVWKLGSLETLIPNATKRFRPVPAVASWGPKEPPDDEAQANASVAEIARTPQAAAALAVQASVPWEPIGEGGWVRWRERLKPAESRAVLQTAARMRPSDPRLTPYLEPSSTATDHEPGPHAFKLIVRGDIDPARLSGALNQLRGLAREWGGAFTINLVLPGSVVVHFTIEGLDDPRARAMTQAIGSLLDKLGLTRSASVSLEPYRFRDYLVESLTVETPSGKRLSVGPVPASMPVEDLTSTAKTGRWRRLSRESASVVSLGSPMGPVASGSPSKSPPVSFSLVGAQGEQVLGAGARLHEAGVKSGGLLRMTPLSSGPESASLRPGALLPGGYRITSSLTRSSEPYDIYLGHEKDLDRDVIIKVLRKKYGNQDTHERFLDEPRLLAMVNAVSSRAVTVLKYDRDPEGRAFYVMEYLTVNAGWHLVHQWISDQGPITVDSPEYLGFARQLQGMLEDFDRAGVIHRDIKPSNLFVRLDSERRPDGLRVIDMGLSTRVSDADGELSLRVGTPGYMAPEQIVGRRQTVDADVWSAAAVLCFVASGHKPFPREQCKQLTKMLGAALPLSVEEYEATARLFEPDHLRSAVQSQIAEIAEPIRAMLAPNAEDRRGALDTLIAQLESPVHTAPRPGVDVIYMAALRAGLSSSERRKLLLNVLPTELRKRMPDRGAPEETLRSDLEALQSETASSSAGEVPLALWLRAGIRLANGAPDETAALQRALDNVSQPQSFGVSAGIPDTVPSPSPRRSTGGGLQKEETALPDLWDVLATPYYDDPSATDLVTRAEIPRRRLRPFGPTPDVWWRDVGRKLEHGIVAHPDLARRRLLAEALQDHPGNKDLQRLAGRL